MVEGGKTPRDLTFSELQQMGVARVSLPLSLLLGAIKGMRNALAHIIANDGTSADPEIFADFDQTHALVGMNQVYSLEARFPRAGTPRAQIPPAKRMKESSAMQSPAKREGYPLGLAAAGGRNRRLRELLRGDALVMAPGCFDCITARLVAGGGFPVAYITGSGVSMSALGAPDLGAISFAEVAERARRIADSVDIPVICDVDTGYGGPINVIRTVRELERAGVSAIQIEDQTWPKKCGHELGRRVVENRRDDRADQGSGGCPRRCRFRRHCPHRCAHDAWPFRSARPRRGVSRGGGRM